MKCPKCGFDQDETSVECFKCGVVFTKFEALTRKKDQVNSRYSPNSNGESALPEDAAPATGPLAALAVIAEKAPAETAPNPPPVSAAALKQFSQSLDKLQTGLTGIMKYQRGLAQELQGQQKQIGRLHARFDEIKAALDQQILMTQQQIREVADELRNYQEQLGRTGDLEDLLSELMSMRESMEELLPVKEFPGLLAALAPRLDRLENQMRLLQSGPASQTAERAAAEHPDFTLLKSEVGALRAEFRHFLQSDTAEEPPAASRDGNWAEFEATVRTLGEQLERQAVRLDQDRLALDQHCQSQAEQLGGMERQLQDLSVSAKSNKQLAADLQHLESAYQKSIDEMRAGLAGLRQDLQIKESSLAGTMQSVAEIQSLLQKMKAVFG